MAVIGLTSVSWAARPGMSKMGWFCILSAELLMLFSVKSVSLAVLCSLIGSNSLVILHDFLLVCLL
jgi:hypothetical protein